MPAAVHEAHDISRRTHQASESWPGILTEAYGLGIPTVAMGVQFGSYQPHPPKAGGGRDRYRWTEALDLLRIAPHGS